MKLRAHYTMKVKSIGSIAFFQEDWMELKEALILAKHIDKKNHSPSYHLKMKKGRCGLLKNLKS